MMYTFSAPDGDTDSYRLAKGILPTGEIEEERATLQASLDLSNLRPSIMKGSHFRPDLA